MKRIYLFNIVAWNYRKKTGFPVCKKENFAGLQAHRKRGKSARASPTPHHTLNEEQSARFTAQPLSALIPRFARPVPQLCMTSTMVIDYLYTHWSHLLTSLNNQLVLYSRATNGDPLCLYGDPAYPHRPQLQSPFKGARLTQNEMDWNSAMSSVRVSVEWVFKDIINYSNFLDFKKNLKVQLSAVGKMYIACTLLHNARCCLYG